LTQIRSHAQKYFKKMQRDQQKQRAMHQAIMNHAMAQQSANAPCAPFYPQQIGEGGTGGGSSIDIVPQFVGSGDVAEMGKAELEEWDDEWDIPEGDMQGLSEIFSCDAPDPGTFAKSDTDGAGGAKATNCIVTSACPRITGPTSAVGGRTRMPSSKRRRT
jgi:hypothetical protein